VLAGAGGAGFFPQANKAVNARDTKLNSTLFIKVIYFSFTV
jgi:hypothetical protein